MKKYNIVMACGCKVRDMQCKFPVNGKEKLLIWDEEDPPKYYPTDENGKAANCFNCPCKRKAKREEKKHFPSYKIKSSSELKTYIVCMPVKNEEITE